MAVVQQSKALAYRWLQVVATGLTAFALISVFALPLQDIDVPHGLVLIVFSGAAASIALFRWKTEAKFLAFLLVVALAFHLECNVVK